MKNRSSSPPCCIAPLVARLILAVLLPCLSSCGKSSKSAKPLGTTEAQVIESKPEIPSGERFAVLKGFEAFTDRSAVVELVETEKHLRAGAGDSEREKVFKPLRQRQLADGRRVEFTRDRVVRLVKAEAALGDFCQVFAEDAPKNAKPDLWVSRRFMVDANDVVGSRVLTGFWIFRGKEGTEIGGHYVTALQDVIAAVYEGEISEDLAKQCVFMPDAQGGEVDTLLDEFVIYREHHPSAQRLIQFAMGRNGSNDPLRSAPVRYTGREQFTTKNGTVRMIPVVATVKGIK